MLGRGNSRSLTLTWASFFSEGKVGLFSGCPGTAAWPRQLLRGRSETLWALRGGGASNSPSSSDSDGWWRRAYSQGFVGKVL